MAPIRNWEVSIWASTGLMLAERTYHLYRLAILRSNCLSYLQIQPKKFHQMSQKREPHVLWVSQFSQEFLYLHQNKKMKVKHRPPSLAAITTTISVSNYSKRVRREVCEIGLHLCLEVHRLLKSPHVSTNSPQAKKFSLGLQLDDPRKITSMNSRLNRRQLW